MLAELHAYAESFAPGPVGVTPPRGDDRRRASAQSNARFTDETTVHEIVAVAMQENWQAVEEHIAYMAELFGQMITQGIAAGEFVPCDAEASARRSALPAAALPPDHDRRSEARHHGGRYPPTGPPAHPWARHGTGRVLSQSRKQPHEPLLHRTPPAPALALGGHRLVAAGALAACDKPTEAANAGPVRR